MSRKLRNAQKYRLGADHHRAKEPAAAVLEAKDRRARGESCRAIGESLGVSRWTVRDWVDGRTRWADRA